MKKLNTALLGLLFMLTLTLQSQTAVTYQGKSYAVQVGSKGGKYILLQDGTKHYIAQDSKVVVSGNTATYLGKSYPITTGSKGGRYFVVNGNKHYITKKQ